MKDFELTPQTYCQFIENLTNEIEEKPLLLVTTQDPNTGKWGMARLWRAWMSTTANFMADNGITQPLIIGKDGRHYGKRPFNKADAHELFTYEHLGADENGNRYSWAKKDHDGMIAAPRQQRFIAMMKHNEYCLERGIKLFKPRDSEYYKLSEEYNGEK